MIARLHLDGIRRHRLIALLIAIATVITMIVAPRIGRADTTRTIVADQDSTVAAVFPDFNFGSWGAMAAGSGTQVAAYVRFPEMRSNPKKAVLRVKGPQAGATIIANRTAASWQEGSLTWRSAQNLTNTTGIATGVRGSDGWTSIDVTTLVASGGVTSFRLRAETRDLMWFSTRESGGAARLELTYPDAVTTTTTSTTRPPVTTTAPPVTTTAPPVTTTAPPPPPGTDAAAANLRMIKESPFRNKLQDNSPYRMTPSAQLPFDVLAPYGKRDQYNDGTDGAEGPFWAGIGAFRLSCEFSHFAYDDPIVKPGQPGAAHLHMFFGNDEANAYSTYNSILNRGGSTCNGGELNRTAYWVPAMIDGKTNRVRVPTRVLVYYKGPGSDPSKYQSYPPNMQVVSDNSINTRNSEYSYQCNNMWNGARSQAQATIPTCTGGNPSDYRAILEQNIKFQNCWKTGSDPANYAANMTTVDKVWYTSDCPAGYTLLPALEYKILYPIAPGEDTSQWFLSSDVNMANGSVRSDRGATNHADWFGGWNKQANDLFIAECVRIKTADCGNGLLGGYRIDQSQYRSLLFRQQYVTPATIDKFSVPAPDLYRSICTKQKTIGKGSDVAFCGAG